MEKTIKDVFIDELQNMLSAEEQIIEALPDMIKASESTDLKNAFEAHLKETKGQVERLLKIFKLLDIEKTEKLCKATKALIDEGKEVIKKYNSSPARDAAIIARAQRIEHYEISAYGSMRTFAKELNLEEIPELLQATLDEEGHADKKLTKIAEGGLIKSGVNHKANIAKEK